MPPTRSSTRAGGGLNLAALTNPAPASTELPDDDFDPTGGAPTRDGDGDSSDGDGFSDDDDDALDRDDGVFRPTEDDEKASGKGGRLRMRGGLSLDELGAEYQGKRTSRKAMEDAWAGEGDDDDDDDDDDARDGLTRTTSREWNARPPMMMKTKTKTTTSTMDDDMEVG